MVFSNNLLFGAAAAATSGAAAFDTTLIGNSIWLEGAGTSGDAMTRTWGSQSNQDRWIWATWFQPLRLADATATRSNLFGTGSGSHGFYLRYNSTGSTFNIFHRDNSGNEGAINTTEQYRDLTAWIHVLVDYDSANANAENRISLYVNGVRTGVNSGNRPAQNNDLQVNVSGQTAKIGQDVATTPNYHTQGYLAQTVFLDNKSIANSDLAITDFLDTFTFGTNGSQIVPKSNTDIIALASAAGNNSFCLDYSDANNIVNDASTKGNNFTPTGGGSPTITSVNQSIHTPSKAYPKITNIGIPSGGDFISSGYSMSRGSNRITKTSGTDPEGLIGNVLIQPSDPKIYWEFYIEAGSVGGSSGGRLGFGLAIPEYNAGVSNGFYGAGGEAAFFYRNGLYIGDGNSAFTDADIAGVGGFQQMAFEPSTGKVWIGTNGTWRNGSATASTTLNINNHDHQLTVQDYIFTMSLNRTSDIGVINFGDNPTYSGNETAVTNADANGHGLFKYAVPSGFLAPVSANLTAPTYQGIDYFDATIYEGNGTGQRVGDFVPFTDIGTISQSVAFNLADSDKLTIASSVSTTPTNVQKKTISVWLKPWKVGENFIMVGVNGSERERIYTTSTGQLQYLTRDSSSTTAHVSTNGAFVADPSQWVHVVFGIDYTNGSTEADRVKIYVNGVQITDLANTSYPANNMTSEAYINKASTEQIIGKHPSTSGGDASNFSDMYYAEYYMVDGLQLTPSTFGQLDTSTNRWVAKSTSTVTSAISSAGGFGNCGFYLNFSNTSDYGEDSSGNNRDFTESGVLDATNQFTDTPSKNYPIVDTGLKFGSATPAITKGGLRFATGGDGGGRVITMQPTSGKWYFEIELTNTTGFYPGLITPAAFAYTGSAPWNETSTFVILSDHPSVRYNNGGTGGSDWGATFSNGDRMAVAWDVPNKKIYFGKAASSSVTWMSASGASGGNPATGVGAVPFTPSMTERLYFAMMFGSNSTDATMKFISSGWEGAAPTGFSELNQDNLDDTASKLTVWSWIKNRDATDSHILVDRIRGVGKTITADETSPAVQQTNMNTVQRFLQRGVQIGNDVTVNTANESYVLWQWLAGNSATTGSTTSPAGTIPSTTIVADAGHFSVGSYTGNGTDNSTVGHGLGAIPEMIIVRNLSRLTYGLLWHKDGYVDGGTGDPSEFVMDFARASNFAANNAKFGGSDETSPTANVFKIGDHNEANANTESFVFYAFRSILGVCKVGLYHGNGNADGTYVSVGFQPKFVMIKSNRNARDFVVADTTRFPANVVGEFLYPSSNAVESARGVTSGSDYDLDILSNGFKLRCADGALNDSTSGSSSYMYIAMADIGGNGTLPPIYGR